MSARLVVVDAGMGNIASVVRALRHAGAEDVTVSADPDRIHGADMVVVPGQGAFRDCSRAFEGGLGEAVRGAITRGVPYLGICLGLQILFESSDEAEPTCRGLGVFAGTVRRLRGGTDLLTGAHLPIPHMGWNLARFRDGRPDDYFYFVHSYAAAPSDANVTLAVTEYGETFTSAVAKDNVLAVQFHPEKSQGAGLAFLRTFVEARP